MGPGEEPGEVPGERGEVPGGYAGCVRPDCPVEADLLVSPCSVL